MLKYPVILLIVIFYIISCNNKKEISKYYIPIDTMAMVIADIHIADATLNIITNTSNFKNPEQYYYSVLRKYNINRKRFDSTLNFYINHKELFEDIYEDIMFILSKKEGEIIALPDDKKLKNDNKNGFRNIVTFISNFDSKSALNKFIDKKTNENSFSGDYSLHFKRTVKNSNKISYKANYFKTIKFSMNFRYLQISKERKKYPSVFIEVQEKEHIILKNEINFGKYISKQGKWEKININSVVELEKFIKNGVINIYITNVFNQNFFIDDLYFSIDIR